MKGSTLRVLIEEVRRMEYQINQQEQTVQHLQQVRDRLNDQHAQELREYNARIADLEVRHAKLSADYADLVNDTDRERAELEEKVREADEASSCLRAERDALRAQLADALMAGR